MLYYLLIILLITNFFLISPAEIVVSLLHPYVLHTVKYGSLLFLIFFFLVKLKTFQRLSEYHLLKSE